MPRRELSPGDPWLASSPRFVTVPAEYQETASSWVLRSMDQSPAGFCCLLHFPDWLTSRANAAVVPEKSELHIW